MGKYDSFHLSVCLEHIAEMFPEKVVISHSPTNLPSYKSYLYFHGQVGRNSNLLLGVIRLRNFPPPLTGTTATLPLSYKPSIERSPIRPRKLMAQKPRLMPR